MRLATNFRLFEIYIYGRRTMELKGGEGPNIQKQSEHSTLTQLSWVTSRDELYKGETQWDRPQGEETRAVLSN